LKINRNITYVGVAIVLIAAAGTVSAQVLDDVEELDWDRPEAWAMKFFNSVSLLTGLGPPTNREPWSFEIGLELDTIPHLDEDQRRVGFGGAKVEDLNRLPVFGRPRLTIGLPAKLSLDVAWVPPVELRGVKSNLFSLALERPVFSTGPWTLGVRVYGQLGTVKGDLTCSEEDASSPPGSPGNIWGCEAPSEDELKLKAKFDKEAMKAAAEAYGREMQQMEALQQESKNAGDLDPNRPLSVKYEVDEGLTVVDDERELTEAAKKACLAWIAERNEWVADKDQIVGEAHLEVWPNEVPGDDEGARVLEGGRFFPRLAN